jgi:Flp pilus assembly protein TadG
MNGSGKEVPTVSGFIGRRRRFGMERGSQLVELGITLPILFLLVVGIWDFGSAFALKQKLTSAAQQGARIVISNSLLASPNCPSVTLPCAITSAQNAVTQYMNNAGLNASCLTSATPATSYPPNPVWTWSCPNSSISLTINRWGADAGADTTVSVTYPVTWSLLNFMGSTVIPNKITTTVTMPNLTN